MQQKDLRQLTYNQSLAPHAPKKADCVTLQKKLLTLQGMSGKKRNTAGEVPPAEGKVLLHVCCAPCSGAIIEKMVAEGLRPPLFWSNSDICTAEENARRLEVLKP